ncbi:hypothetical protein [Amycolatopsis sp. WGS_07]|uniref:hypothetical protein n=1 Tax=Amycolatopsis sp. WGS_07 TaxID=3076764 RepID=UPI00387317CE
MEHRRLGASGLAYGNRHHHTPDRDQFLIPPHESLARKASTLDAWINEMTAQGG